MIEYNPLNKFYKSVKGAVRENEQVVFRVKSQGNYCCFVVRRDDTDQKEYFSMSKRGEYFEVSVLLKAGLYWYCFDLGDGNFIGVDNNLEGELTRHPHYFQLTVFSENFKTPDWIKGGIIYQIFPDRFYRGEEKKSIKKGKILHDTWGEIPVYLPNENGKIINNDFFGGDFLGITKKLDYLKSLSVNTIYLNPVFEAYSNHRYDTGDYTKFDALLGTEEDFKNLLKEAKKRGIKVILDGVFNHTGDDSIYFNKYGNYNSVGAFQDKKSKYRKWYKFTLDNTTYESWWGILTLPSLDKNNPEYLDFVTGENGVIERYMKMGIGGFRLDVVDELPEHFVKAIRRAVKGIDNDGIVIGEVWEDASNKVSYGVRRKYFQGKELDSTMNYPLKNAILEYALSGDETTLLTVIREQLDHYPKAVLDCMMNMLATHDTFRLISALSGYNVKGKSKSELAKISIDKSDLEKVVNRLKIATLIQYTLYGVPSVYYGDEVGLEGYTDPLNRKCFPWGNENTEILSWFRFLGEFRRSNPVFKTGDTEVIYAKDGCIVYKRFDENSDVAVAVNLGKSNKEIIFNGCVKDVISGEVFVDKLTLKPNSFYLLQGENIK